MEKNKSGERKQIKEESKKKADCAEATLNERIESQKQEEKQHKKLKKEGGK